MVCNQPPTILNALHNAPREQARFPAGTELMYTCRSSYTASGYQRAMCKGDGTWSGPKMTCSSKYCYVVQNLFYLVQYNTISKCLCLNELRSKYL